MCVPHLWRKFAFPFMSLTLSLKIRIFLFHIRRACYELFDLLTQKSDITQASYELFDLLTHPSLCLHDLRHKLVISIMSLALSFKILFVRFACLNINI